MKQTTGAKVKTKNNFRPVILLPWLGLCILLSIVAAIGGYGISKLLETNSSNVNLLEDAWIQGLNVSLDSLGVNVYDIQIIEIQGLSGGRELVVSIGESLDQMDTTPYYLVSGIHLLIFAAYPTLIEESEIDRKIEFVRVNVTRESGDIYSVVVNLDDIFKVVQGTFTQSDYVNRWQMEGNYPEFTVPNE